MAIIALTNPYALKNATLSIEADDYTAAVTQVEFTPSVATSTVRTIDGVAHKDQSTSEWNCTIGFIQDLDPSGLLRYMLDNDGESKAVVFVPSLAVRASARHSWCPPVLSVERLALTLRSVP